MWRRRAGLVPSPFSDWMEVIIAATHTRGRPAAEILDDLVWIAEESWSRLGPGWFGVVDLYGDHPPTWELSYLATHSSFPHRGYARRAKIDVLRRAQRAGIVEVILAFTTDVAGVSHPIWGIRWPAAASATMGRMRTADPRRPAGDRGRSGRLLASMADEVEQPAQPAIRVPLACDELRLKDQVLRVRGGTVGCPAVREEAHPIPGDGIDAPLGDELAEMVDPVAACFDTETVDLSIAVERGDRRGPVALVGVTQRHDLDVLRHDRDHARRCGEPAERVDERLGVVEVHKDSVAQDGVEAGTIERVSSVLAGCLDQTDPSCDLGILAGEAPFGALEHGR